MENPYASTPLIKKLGIKPGFTLAFIDPPEDFFFDSLIGLPEELDLREVPEYGEMDYVHYFTKSAADLIRDFSKLKDSLKTNGMLWISWPKKASKVQTDVDGNLVRATGLENGLVDAKVCSIDEVWSAIRFVYRKEDR